jgi:NAD+ kinase
MSSTTGSNTPSADPVRTAAVVTHGHREAIGEALERLERVAAKGGVELLYPEDEAQKHDRTPDGDLGAADLVVVLGGDGTMLRALKRSLGSGPPAVNDVVVASSIIGRMIELGWSIGGEDLGALPCDGVICSTPSGSTGYNLSNGGPVLVWGLDAQTVTFIAAHSLHARPLVVARGSDVKIENRTRDVPAQVLVDGRPVTQLAGGEQVVARLGAERTRLAHLPEATFFRRYRQTFAS